MAELIFWLSSAFIAWTYAIFPAAIVVRARRARAKRTGTVRHPRLTRHELVASTSVTSPPPPEPDTSPRVSVVVAVRDGAPWLDARINNLLAQDYSPDRTEILVVCNGSQDGSEEIARSRSDVEPRLRVLRTRAEDGKAGALNAGVAAATGEVIIFADARQQFERDAISLLVEALSEPGVGAVTGRLVPDRSGVGAVDGFQRYWELETMLRLAESETGSVMGATGAIYAVRRASFRPVPPGTILDDVYIPARVALCGERVSMEPRAVARDIPTESHGREYRRRVRMLAGNLQLVGLLPELVRPGSGLFLRFLSHKLLRVVSPVFFVAVAVTGFWVGTGVYLVAAVGLTALYAAGLVGLLLYHPFLSLPSAFVMVHAAAFDAMLRWRRGAADLWSS
jgi:cellulose synthase/poly-beta-1,6-N-acetylglucosamine synthase-like glycosyltransferase